MGWQQRWNQPHTQVIGGAKPKQPKQPFFIPFDQGEEAGFIKVFITKSFKTPIQIELPANNGAEAIDLAIRMLKSAIAQMERHRPTGVIDALGASIPAAGSIEGA